MLLSHKKRDQCSPAVYCGVRAVLAKSHIFHSAAQELPHRETSEGDPCLTSPACSQVVNAASKGHYHQYTPSRTWTE